MVNHPNRSKRGAATFSKHREGDGWRVHKDGRPTDLVIVRDLPPKFGNPQMWDVCDADDFLFEAKGLGCAMATLERLMLAISEKD